MKNIEEWLFTKLSLLENVFNSGNLGALKDAVFWCNKYEKPLPGWVNNELLNVLNALSNGDEKTLKKWRKWGREYKQDMADYEILDLVEECRNNGAQWKDDDIFSIAAAIISNKTEEEGGAKANTLKKARQRALRKMKLNPYRYFQLKTFQTNKNLHPYSKELWQWVKNMITAGNPRNSKKL